VSVLVAGGGFVLPSGFGKIRDIPLFNVNTSIPALPDLKDIAIKTPGRWGRFDLFTRLGYISAAMALQDAGYDGLENANCGMVASSCYETVNTDRRFYDTTIEAGGAFSSPNLFSYTLPVTLIGECCSQFHLKGPSFSLGDNAENKGLSVIKTAVRFIESGTADKMLAGVVEDPPEEVDAYPFSIFVLLEKGEMKKENGKGILTMQPDGTIHKDGKMLWSIGDLFHI